MSKRAGEISRRNTLQCRWCASIGDSSWTFLALDVCGARPGGLVAAVTPCVYRDQFHVSILFLPYGTHSDLFRWSPVHKVVKRLLALDSEEKEQLGTYIHQLSDFRNFASGHKYSPISISHLYIYTSITKARITHLSFCFFISLLPDVSGGRGDGPTRETISILRGKMGQLLQFFDLESRSSALPQILARSSASVFVFFIHHNGRGNSSKTKIPRQIWLKWSEGQLLQCFGSNEDQYINICKINGGLVFTHQHTHTLDLWISMCSFEITHI